MSMTLDRDHCRARQQRLLEIMRQRDIRWTIVTRPESVQYFTGVRLSPLLESLAAINREGETTLVVPEHRVQNDYAADKVIPYAARWHSTLRNDQHQQIARELASGLSTPTMAGVVAMELGCVNQYIQLEHAGIDITADLLRLRRTKDADEMALLQRAFDATRSMYERAREIVQVGVNELDVFNELHAVAVRSVGEPLTALGNDFQAHSRGGPPRNRTVHAGELYILDLGPAYRGYFADNARTLAVADPTPLQQEAWRRVTEVFSLVESEVRPGVSARGLFDRVQALLDRAPCGVFNHHLGHGIGLYPHEGPHLNPQWDDTFAVGDVFTAEPGLYAPELRAGLRIENAYHVVADGVERLTDYPLELKL